MSENRARGAIWRPGVQKETVIQVFKATVTLFNVFWYRAQSWCFWKNWNEQGVVSAYNCLFHKYFFSIYFVPGIRQDIIELQMVNHVFYLQGASGFFFFPPLINGIYMPVLNLILILDQVKRQFKNSWAPGWSYLHVTEQNTECGENPDATIW